MSMSTTRMAYACGDSITRHDQVITTYKQGYWSLLNKGLPSRLCTLNGSGFFKAIIEIPKVIIRICFCAFLDIIKVVPQTAIGIARSRDRGLQRGSSSVVSSMV